MAKVSIDLGERVAVVSPGSIGEKYARKVLQDKLKTDTPFGGGWECYLTNRAQMDTDHYRATKQVRYFKQEDYIFKLTNPFASMAGYI